MLVLQAIKVEGLTVEYSGKRGQAIRAVDDLSFAVSPGEIVGFLGPNGAGKSSTLKALMGFLKPTHGTLQIFDAVAGDVSAKQHIGYLPEVALYYPYLSPLETLRLYGTLQGIPKRDLEHQSRELLDAVGIGNVMDKQNRALSKGMLQRVGVAQALLGSPKLLILDEFTSGLDPIGRQEIRNVLMKHRSAGCTLFFSSHELAEVEMLCDRILLIDQGKLLDERVVSELKQELTQHALSYRGDVEVSDLTNDLELLGDNVIRAEFDSKHNLLVAIARVQGHAGVITDVVAREGSLEEYFVQTVGRAA